MASRIGSPRADDRLSWVAPDPSSAAACDLTLDDRPGRCEDDRDTLVDLAPAVADGLTSSSTAWVRSANAAIVIFPTALSLGRAPPLA